ncbi:MAG: glycosyltransferase family 87 protein [Chloroflexota bacterium]
MGITRANYQYVLTDTGMNAFLPAWNGTRELLMKGWSPYSDATLQETQKLAYGRPASQGEEQGLFLYPFYATLIFAPFGLFADFAVARALWMTILELALAGTVGMGINLLGWRLSRWLQMILLVLALVWYFSIRALLDGDAVILSTFFITAAFLAIRTDHDALAGFLWVLASTQGGVMPLVTLFLIVWAVSNQRWSLVMGLLLNAVFLVAVTSLLLPDWAMQWVRQVVAYTKSAFLLTPGSLLFYWLPGVGRQLGQGLMAVMAGLLVWEWRDAWGKDFRWFLWTAYLTLTVTGLIGMPTSLKNYVVMLPALILVLATWYARWGRLGTFLMIISLMVLSFGIWAISIGAVRSDAPLELNPGLFFFFPIFLLVGLYWVRRWAIRPQHLFMDNLNRRLGG